MKKILLTSVLGISAMMLSAQSAVDAYQLSQTDLKGTARSMSMAGAFGALGGDLSSLNQNPGGIGIYRSSEIGLTFDVNMQSSKTNSMGTVMKADQTKVHFNNFGYVGSVKLGSDVMPYFTWGASYSRVASFDRVYRGHIPSLSTSMSNYIANFSNDWTTGELLETKYHNPYQDTDAPWLSVLAYNAYMINPVTNSTYNGLFKSGTTGDAMFNVREKGYIDEYSINFGGNVKNMVYWGIGFGITDIDFSSVAYYDEELQNAAIANADATGMSEGNAYFNMGNYQRVSGNGVNFKAGVIVKPINELRLGLAVHTPTYYDLQHETLADVEYSYAGDGYVYDGYKETDEGYIGIYDSKLNTPWRIIASAAGVIGGKGIVSFDYEWISYSGMTVKDRNGFEYDDVNSDIDNYYKAQNIFRIGAEYRVTPAFSVRAGYSYKSSPVTDLAESGREYVYTSGTNPAYCFDKSTQYITCGLGYRYKAFYVDAAYVHKNKKSTYHAFTSFNNNEAPTAEIAENNNTLVFSLGFRF